MNFKRACAGFLAAALCVGLSACARDPRSSESQTEIVLPEPSPETVNMILGERIASEPESVTLYYVAGDGTSFSTVTRSMVISPGENLYEEAVKALLSSGSTPDRMAFLPMETRVLDVEYACGIATVNLSLDAHSVQSEQESLMLLASIANTLLSIDEVKGVNVLIGNQSEAIAFLPTGAQTEPFAGITPAYAQMSAEREYFLESETGTITRSAVLYFPAVNGSWLVPELREISFDSSDYASGLIRALRAGPTVNSSATTAVPESVDLLVNNPQTEVLASGERVLRLDFSSTLRNYLAFSGQEEWELIGSVVMTICSFVPEIDAVQIFIGDEPVTSCTIEDKTQTFPDGLIRRADFAPYVGSAVGLWLPKDDGTFERVERAVSMVRAQSPQSVLYALFDHVLAHPESAQSFPSGVYYEDVLGVSIQNGIAHVNLSANFYRQCQTLDSAAERGVVYAIVNTLCELDGISGVRFYIEGIAAQTLSGSIYLKGMLLPNPGLLPEDASDEVTATP